MSVRNQLQKYFGYQVNRIKQKDNQLVGSKSKMDLLMWSMIFMFTRLELGE